MSRRRVLTEALLAALLAACSNSAPDYCGKTCGVDQPCASGYTCDASSGF